MWAAEIYIHTLISSGGMVTQFSPVCIWWSGLTPRGSGGVVTHCLSGGVVQPRVNLVELLSSVNPVETLYSQYWLVLPGLLGICPRPVRHPATASSKHRFRLMFFYSNLTRICNTSRLKHLHLTLPHATMRFDFYWIIDRLIQDGYHSGDSACSRPASQLAYRVCTRIGESL